MALQPDRVTNGRDPQRCEEEPGPRGGTEEGSGGIAARPGSQQMGSAVRATQNQRGDIALGSPVASHVGGRSCTRSSICTLLLQYDLGTRRSREPDGGHWPGALVALRLGGLPDAMSTWQSECGSPGATLTLNGVERAETLSGYVADLGPARAPSVVRASTGYGLRYSPMCRTCLEPADRSVFFRGQRSGRHFGDWPGE
jgi:hypothetical protein